MNADLEGILEDARGIRSRSLQIAERLCQIGNDYKIPPDSGALALVTSRLERDEYRVPIVGEIKRGKSTFLSALTSRTLLPTDVDVATNKVFRIANASHDSFRLRFEDETSKPILAGEIAQYGSQVAADKGGAPALDQMIRWIEIDIPFEILPKNIIFFDTPGVGGLNVLHAEITERFLPEADGVIFVIDSEKPIEDSELNFLELVLKHTRHVFFVQTKTDRNESGWAEIRNKSQKNLRNRFGDRLSSVSVWPFSSTKFQKACLLFKAGENCRTEAGRALGESHFPALNPGLMTFLYRILGWSRAADVAYFSRLHFQAGQKFLSESIQSLSDESRQTAQEFRSRHQEKRRWYDEASAEFSQLRSRLIDEFRGTSSEAAHELQTGLAELETEMLGNVENVKHTTAARRLAENFEENLAGSSSRLWRTAGMQMRDAYTKALAQFLETNDHEFGVTERMDPDANLPRLEIEQSLMRRLQSAGATAASFGTVVGLPAAALSLAGILAPPLGAALLALGTIASIWGFFQGWKQSAKTEAEASRSKLQFRLQKIMSTIRPYYARAADNLSHELERLLRRQIDDLAGKKRAEANAELKRLEEEEQMTAKERADRLKVVQIQASQWKELGGELSQLEGDLVKLHNRLSLTAK
jgi:signal recognition particle receptor subunit beta